MIDLQIIENEIETLKNEEATYNTCQKLACLYIVRDNLAKEKESDSSDFIRACAGVPTDKLLEIINEHMEAVEVVYPAEYRVVYG